MIKRTLSLFCAAMVLVSCLVFPALAADDDSTIVPELQIPFTAELSSSANGYFYTYTLSDVSLSLLDGLISSGSSAYVSYNGTLYSMPVSLSSTVYYIGDVTSFDKLPSSAYPFYVLYSTTNTRLNVYSVDKLDYVTLAVYSEDPAVPEETVPETTVPVTPDVPEDDSPAAGLLGDLASIAGSIVDSVNTVVVVIVDTPLLLFVFGIFFLGACIAIFGRTSDKR